MSEYVIGGWTQNLTVEPPVTFSYSIYGMITNFIALTSGTPDYPGWSVAATPAPKVSGKVLWAYGGLGGTPTGTPFNQTDIEAIISATTSQDWAGVDVDNESEMNIDNVINMMSSLKKSDRETSYTFIAGWDYNHPESEPGATINREVKAIADSGACDRFCLMCYGDAMWPLSDITANVGPAIDRTIAHAGDPKKVILALTPAGLNSENLAYFLDQVTSKGIGGLFIWEFSTLQAADLQTIQDALAIS
ncbi:hypothetical protein [Desulfotalea psychrophila]|uniref:GH18 domain-containing protein n=1 Tax=Desulfotalea psychrophila (strain LSv54 / DSM 12343) TaxID=177439 RepID=Q6ALY2_DESPS|nr:hypothetical protein [Desulfotalea psychrophila]CAG36643.1 unknown protein [Desulfotalea psychrophila LSv54]